MVLPLLVVMVLKAYVFVTGSVAHAVCAIVSQRARVRMRLNVRLILIITLIFNCLFVMVTYFVITFVSQICGESTNSKA